MAIVKSYQRKTDTTYVYESEPYWDPEKKQSRSKRKLIGKIDKETGEIVPTGPRGRKKQEAEGQGSGKAGMPGSGPEAVLKLERVVAEQKREILALRTEIDRLKRENRQLQSGSIKAGELAKKEQQLGEFIRDFRSLADKARSAGLFGDM